MNMIKDKHSLLNENSFIPLSRPTIEEEEIEEVVNCLKSGWITTGKLTARFEEEFKNYIGCKHAIAVSSGTAALHLAYITLGIGPGDEVITSPITFCATVNMIEITGATPKFADIDPNTLQISPDDIENRITPNTKAIVPVHFAGQPADLDCLKKIAKKHGLSLVEDAAHAVGTEYKEEKIGKNSELAIFSFHPIKNITTGEGGMVVTSNSSFAEKIKILRFHGLSADAWRRYERGGNPRVMVLMPGFKYNFMDIQAAIGIHQLPKLSEFNKRRAEISQIYDEAFSSIDEVEPISPVSYPHLHTHHLYIIKLSIEKLKVDRYQFIEFLKEEGIGSGVHFEAVHLMPYYREKYGFAKGNFPKAEFVSERILSIPLYPMMKNSDVKKVIKGIKKVIGKVKK